MADNKILKQVLLNEVIVKGMVLAQLGSVEDMDIYPDYFVKLTIGPEDFANNEEYHTVMRLLTKVAKRKVTALVEEGKIDVIREKSTS